MSTGQLVLVSSLYLVLYLTFSTNPSCCRQLASLETDIPNLIMCCTEDYLGGWRWHALPCDAWDPLPPPSATIEKRSFYGPRVALPQGLPWLKHLISVPFR